MASWSHDSETVSFSKEVPTLEEHLKPPHLDVEKLAGYEALRAAFPNVPFRKPATDAERLQKPRRAPRLERHL